MRLFQALVFLLNLGVDLAMAQHLSRFQPLRGISIRALEAVSDNEVWFAADHGVFGHTTDGGRTWKIDSVRVNGAFPQFRSLAVLNDSTVLLLSIASPAHLMRSTDRGKTWNEVFRHSHPEVFFDSMVFTDENNGYAVSDPLNGHFVLISTTDGGKTWAEMNNAGWPETFKNEAFFASSNANLSVTGKVVRLVTGGNRSRLLTSFDAGKSFSAVDLPLPRGGTMTGAFAMHFFTEQLGAVTGGDYEHTAAGIPSLTVTTDGGKSWQNLTGSRPFFGSSVRFRNANELYVTGHEGTFRFELPSGRSTELTNARNEPLKFHTLRLSPSGQTIWLAGGDGQLASIVL